MIRWNKRPDVPLSEKHRHVKSARKDVPPKADHKHEYIQPFAILRVRLPDGSVSEPRKCRLETRCIDCGHRNRKAYARAVEVEISKAEYRSRIDNGERRSW